VFSELMNLVCLKAEVFIIILPLFIFRVLLQWSQINMDCLFDLITMVKFMII
jgi:hypothetical protein